MNVSKTMIMQGIIAVGLNKE